MYVIPAQAGIQARLNYFTLDSRFHGNDGNEGLTLGNQALWAYIKAGPFGVGFLLALIELPTTSPALANIRIMEIA